MNNKFQSMKHLKVDPLELKGNELEEIFNLQEKMNLRFYDARKMSQPLKIMWTLKLCMALGAEMFELIDQLPWKWWKKYKDSTVDVYEVKFEVIDMMHFVVSLALLWGMDSREFMAHYRAKMAENVKRQENGY